MKFIVDAEPDEAPAVLARMIEMIPRFNGRSRPGWGWHESVGGKTYFIRETKTGLSASRPNSQGLSQSLRTSSLEMDDE